MNEQEPLCGCRLLWKVDGSLALMRRRQSKIWTEGSVSVLQVVSKISTAASQASQSFTPRSLVAKQMMTSHWTRWRFLILLKAP